MGIGYASAKWLYWTKIKYGVDFSNIAVLGRQSFGNGDFLKAQRELGYIFNVKDIWQIDGYSEKFWKALGGETSCLDVFDYSDYEGANCIHDMNVPVPEKWKDRYSAVIDGGTLEHVFNYPQGLKNIMSMVRRGGHLILQTPANQWMDHGFYQFSPQLFNSILSEKNGYEIKELTFYDVAKSSKRAFSRLVGDAVIQRKTKNPVLLFVIAKRIGDVPEEIVVQQSGYVATWDSKNDSSITADREIRFPRVHDFMLLHPIIGARYFHLVNSILYHSRNPSTRKVIQQYDIDKEIKSILRRER